MLCSFCHKDEPVRIDLNTLDLRICPACKASFLPAEQFPELRRCLVNTTKTHWIKALESASVAQPENMLCILHNEALVPGEVPGFSVESLVPKCCSLQHLSPNTMIKILKMGLSLPRHRKQGGISRLFGAFFFSLWEKRNPIKEDDIDKLQYNFKFKEILGA